MRRKDRRAPRARLLGTEPLPLDRIAGQVDDHSVEARVDGYTGRLDSRPPRSRARSVEPLPLSDLQILQAIACCTVLWDLAARIDAEIPGRSGAGRPRATTTAAVMLFEIATWEKLSYRAVDRCFADPTIWTTLRTAVATAWPDRPERRLPALPATRDQHYRFRRRHLENEHMLDLVRACMLDWSTRAAIEIGLFDGSGSVTHPPKSSIVAGDATWIVSMFNTPPGHTTINPVTGEIVHRRADPDAVAYHRTDTGPGRHLVTALARSEHGNERIILDLAFKPKKGSDATLFTDIALELSTRLPGMRGIVYDMALHAADTDRFLDAGLIPIAKVQRTSANKPAAGNLGEHTFTHPDRTTSRHVVYSVDGTPCIQTVIDDAIHLVPLHRQQLKTQPNRDGTHRVYGHWTIPDQPAIPRRLRGARTLIRHNSDTAERANNTRRTRSLRPIAENDPDFARLYGLREDTESMHHHLKQRMWNNRARTVGLQRQRLNHHAYQLRTLTTALLAWHRRTGNTLNAWTGQWQPFNHAAAA